MGLQAKPRTPELTERSVNLGTSELSDRSLNLGTSILSERSLNLGTSKVEIVKPRHYQNQKWCDTPPILSSSSSSSSSQYGYSPFPISGIETTPQRKMYHKPSKADDFLRSRSLISLSRPEILFSKISILFLATILSGDCDSFSMRKTYSCFFC